MTTDTPLTDTLNAMKGWQSEGDRYLAMLQHARRLERELYNWVYGGSPGHEPRDDEGCPECARSFGPHYAGTCEH